MDECGIFAEQYLLFLRVHIMNEMKQSFITKQN